MSTAWIQVAAARRDLADLVETLTPAQQQGPTLCAGWTPHHVLAHVTSFVEVPLPRYLLGVLRAKGNFDAMADSTARRLAEQPVDELATILRVKADKKNALPGFPAEMTLTDVVVHTQDVRRATGVPGEVPVGRVRIALDFLTRDRAAKYLSDRSRISGLALQATDIDWSYGDQHAAVATLVGTGEALMMAICGRDTTAELAGPVDRLRVV
jgi:uncharacterized protein (TIGR03083 family)